MSEFSKATGYGINLQQSTALYTLAMNTSKTKFENSSIIIASKIKIKEKNF